MTKYYYYVAQFTTDNKSMNYASIVQAIEGCDHFKLNANREYVAERFGIKKTDVIITLVLEITKEEVELFSKDANF